MAYLTAELNYNQGQSNNVMIENLIFKIVVGLLMEIFQ